MTDDTPERLRAAALANPALADLLNEAAQEIELLESQVDRLWYSLQYGDEA